MKLEDITLTKSIALVGTGIGAYYVFQKSAIPVIGGALGYIGGSLLGWSEGKMIAAGLAGAGAGFVAERTVTRTKNSAWCKEHYIQALWDDRCEGLSGIEAEEPYGYLTNRASRYKFYNCIWQGAKDSTSGDNVSVLIDLLHDNGYIPTSYPKRPDGLWAGGGVDAVFDASVDKAVKAFQKNKGLPDDGVVGRNTWKALGVTDPANVLTKDCPPDPSKLDYPTEPGKEPTIKTLPALSGIPTWALVAGGVGVVGLSVYAAMAWDKKRRG